MKKTIKFRVFRGSPDKGHEKDYTVETFPGMVVLDAIHQIQQEQDKCVPRRR